MRFLCRIWPSLLLTRAFAWGDRVRCANGELLIITNPRVNRRMALRYFLGGLGIGAAAGLGLALWLLTL